MADVEHKTLPDAELHETKGIASATAGQILVADGAGSGTFQIGANFANQFANTIIINNTTVIAVPVATDSTLHTAADYVSIPPALITQDLSQGITFDVNDAFVINASGTYFLQAWGSLSSTGTNNTVALAYSINGVFDVITRPVIKVKLKVAGDIISLSGFGIFNLNIGDVLRLGLADDTGTDVTLHEFCATLVKESN